MQVLIADPLAAETRAGLEGLGFMVSYDPDVAPHLLAERVGDVDILIVGRTRVTRRTIEAAEHLRIILHAGVGVDSIDVQAASERGIIVADCGDADVNARAELAFGMVLALDRGLHIPDALERSKSEGLGLCGRTLGLLGWDALAQALAVIARGFGMRVLAHGKGLTSTLAAEAGVHWSESGDELFAKADVVSLHPADGTAAHATAARVGSLSDGATLLVMTARDLVDFDAVKARLEAGTLRLATDVYDANDFDDDVPFAADAYRGLCVTHRSGARTRQMEDAINHRVVMALEHFLTHRVMPGATNLGSADAPVTLLIRHRPTPGLLLLVFEILRDSGVTVSGVDTQTFDEGVATLLALGLDAAPSTDAREELERLSGVLGVEIQHT